MVNEQRKLLYPNRPIKLFFTSILLMLCQFSSGESILPGKIDSLLELRINAYKSVFIFEQRMSHMGFNSTYNELINADYFGTGYQASVYSLKRRTGFEVDWGYYNVYRPSFKNILKEDSRESYIPFAFSQVNLAFTVFKRYDLFQSNLFCADFGLGLLYRYGWESYQKIDRVNSVSLLQFPLGDLGLKTKIKLLARKPILRILDFGLDIGHQLFFFKKVSPLYDDAFSITTTSIISLKLTVGIRLLK